MTPFRVLHLVANRWWTGSADPALDLARTLRCRGHVVRFACIRGDALEARARAAALAPVEGLSLERTAPPWVLVRDVRRLGRLVREERIQIVHAHQSHDHWLAALGVKGTGARLVRTVHHRRAAHGGLAARWLFRRTAAVIVASRAIADAVRGVGLAAARLEVVPGAVDLSRFPGGLDGAGVRVELGLGGSPVVGSVARLVPGRGHEVLLRAARLLRTRIPTLRLLLVGRGEGQPALERLSRELGLEDAVVFAGYRSDDLPAILAAIDCFVLLGAGSEESCRAVLEAMAAGRPVVAAPVGALPETVIDGETGWLVAPEPAAVSERLERVLGDVASARAMGVAGRRRVEAAFTPERRAAAVERIYADLLGPARDRADAS